jgi:hypothetical protein
MSCSWKRNTKHEASLSTIQRHCAVGLYRCPHSRDPACPSLYLQSIKLEHYVLPQFRDNCTLISINGYPYKYIKLNKIIPLVQIIKGYKSCNIESALTAPRMQSRDWLSAHL